MNIFKRSLTSVLRQPVKSLILFLLLIILGSMMTGAIAVGNAIQVAERNLRRSIPAVATLDHDTQAVLAYIDEYEDFPDWESSLTSQIIEEIGNLPYVRAFDYAILDSTSFFSRELVFSRNPEPYLITGLDEAVILSNLDQLSLNMNGLQLLNVRGIYHHQVFDLQEGLIELLEGRIFTEEEMRTGTPVVLISAAFAEANHLEVGSTVVLEQNFYDWQQPTFEAIFRDDNLLMSELLEIEVIGIFTPTLEMNASSNFVEMHNHMEFNNLIYAPLEMAKRNTYLWLDYLQEEAPERVPDYEDFWYEHVVYVLDDPLYLDDFTKVALELLPEFWLTEDLRSSYGDMSASLETMRSLVNWVMAGATVGTVAILSLLVILFLRDRQHEIGVYLALGESRKKIVVQLLIEIFSVAIFTTFIALVVGYVLADHFSQEMVRQELMVNRTSQNFDMVSFGLNQMGFGFWMSHEEMIEAYAVTISGRLLLTFIGVFMGTLLVSTLLPVFYLSKLSPKDILTKGSIG